MYNMSAYTSLNKIFPQQKSALTALTSMLLTYQTAMELPGQHQHHIADIPRILQQVDMLHGLTQTLTTSEKEVLG
jgi:hypothetical protein